MVINLQIILTLAKLWSAYLDIGISPKEVAVMMCLLKIARTKLHDLSS